ncbi:hypothetical protein [Actinomadura sp. WMMB 499]|uniref:hypothetical protein n=1 Tax=Actinomadura sp. WMMB 499 TaxID=1219491 RepID=UPI0020C7F9BF|nr:hypothetical protein [Actinomadura sp. WMMB 499]
MAGTVTRRSSPGPSPGRRGGVRVPDEPPPDLPRLPGPRANAPLVRLRPGWPLTAIFLLFPLWWVLGLGALIFMIMAVPMGLYLWRRRDRIVTPRGFGAWLLFLAWVLFGAATLWAEVPGTQQSGGAGRLLVFAWRYAWYLACTIVLLYIGNTSERELPTGRIGNLLGVMFIVTTFGGMIGLLMPNLQLTSPVEMVLPNSLASNAFIEDIVHPKTAEVESILGYEQARPMAPFAYANTWGAAYALFLPFFLITWVARARGTKRIAGITIFVVSLWPVVYSLNRGLWLALALIAGYAALSIVIAGGWKMATRAGAVLAVGAVVVAFSPLPGMIGDRLSNPHSNNRRVQLAVETVQATVTGSPLVGFGSTRDVQGNFNSVGGGSRPGCDACAVPPLGTQGHLWLLIFAHGIGGTLAFLAFFLRRFGRHWRDRTAYSLAGCCVLVASGLFLFVYDIVEVPLYTVMIAVALMWRAERDKRAAKREAIS